MGQFLPFGEIMLRLPPLDRELLLQTPRLDVRTAGAAADVALVALRQEAGLGDAAPASLRSRDTFAAGVEVRR